MGRTLKGRDLASRAGIAPILQLLCVRLEHWFFIGQPQVFVATGIELVIKSVLRHSADAAKN